MRRITICLLVFSALVVTGLTLKSAAQQPEIPTPDYPFPGYPEEFSPLATAREQEQERSYTPDTKFLRASTPLPNRYIVVLNDNLYDPNATPEARRSVVSRLASAAARAHGGTVGFIYETALMGYSIELPNEAAAIALSNNSNVKWVEEEGQSQVAQQAPDVLQNNPPWGLDGIDGTFPTAVPNATGTTTGQYNYNRTGAFVTAYVIDTGINRFHSEFGTNTRAFQAADCIAHIDCKNGGSTGILDVCGLGMPNGNNNDCHGHGTHVAGTIGGSTYGAAKDVTIKSVKVCTVNGCQDSVIIAGINWVTNDHLQNFNTPAVVNMSIWNLRTAGQNPTGVDAAVNASINSGLTYAVPAGNNNRNALEYYPADVTAALTVGAVDWTGARWQFSNWGPAVDLFAPGVEVLSSQSGNGLCLLWDGGDTSSCKANGTSQAAAHVAGTVALYLQGRASITNCNGLGIQGPASSAGLPVGSCPDRISRWMTANANLFKLSGINGTPPGGPPNSVASANRFPLTFPIDTAPANPIDNHRFFVWQQYADFLPAQPQPDEGGLDWWTQEITGHGHCTATVNFNYPCTDVQRVLTSRAFWLAIHPELFTSDYSLKPEMNSQFIQLAYQIYLRRNADAGGLAFWTNELAVNYGDPANSAGVFHVIDAFIRSGAPDGYRRRFGQ